MASRACLPTAGASGFTWPAQAPGADCSHCVIGWTSRNPIHRSTSGHRTHSSFANSKRFSKRSLCARSFAARSCVKSRTTVASRLAPYVSNHHVRKPRRSTRLCRMAGHPSRLAIVKICLGIPVAALASAMVRKIRGIEDGEDLLGWLITCYGQTTPVDALYDLMTDLKITEIQKPPNNGSRPYAAYTPRQAPLHSCAAAGARAIMIARRQERQHILNAQVDVRC